MTDTSRKAGRPSDSIDARQKLIDHARELFTVMAYDKVSFISLMVFPFIAPQSLLAIHGIDLSEEFLNQLLEHNIKLMTNGMLLPNDLQEHKL
ncbi:hypothetical protein [Vibrio sp. STUT-A11]|uniref:hypothetical protein n=1 Tax=Vibrio sp. STUT-A11 TaxID=2976236 RepID=UPI0022326C06|nr:hypothetical protein [Vibrio sp. STUT-A11]BDR15873.1 hypothetical protein VspSTUT11_38490 [Vibrio sp. STUT-A11]